MPAFPPQNSTARCLKQILEMYCLNISLSHAMSQTPHQAYILMLIRIWIDFYPEKGKVWYQFLQFPTAAAVKMGIKTHDNV